MRRICRNFLLCFVGLTLFALLAKGQDDQQSLGDVARKAASYSQVMDTKGPKMVRGDFSAEGRARQTLKDVELMLAQARKVGQDLPLARLNAEVLQACVRNGEGDQDNSVVINEIRRRVEPGPSR